MRYLLAALRKAGNVLAYGAAWLGTRSDRLSRRPGLRKALMLAVAAIPRMRVPGGVNAGHLGWMSEQWLAEHRASHSA